jgi:hypothetical protein
MTDIIDAQFADFPNRSGQTTFSYAQLLAQLTQDIPSGGGGPFAGQGAQVRRPNAISIANNVHTDIIFNNLLYDDLNFWDGATKLIIPVTDPQISRVSLVGYHVWSSGGPFTYEISVQKNNGAVNGGVESLPFTIAGDFVQHMSGVVMGEPVVAGDEFTLDVLTNSSPPLAQTSIRAVLSLVVEQ